LNPRKGGKRLREGREGKGFFFLVGANKVHRKPLGESRRKTLNSPKGRERQNQKSPKGIDQGEGGEENEFPKSGLILPGAKCRGWGFLKSE